ncbi:ADP-ribosylglycohydrolase family protein [Rhodoferax sp.]|uniref:ADP-ribosylglycohydrolase family protein n=1 Tax=Rhodoferax sp. TaxID=50421 RepID=UPI003BB091B2|nr:ADP-ribosylglycohydrolase family protein [Rhodoferax sp.]
MTNTSLQRVIEAVLPLLAAHPDHEETTRAIAHACRLAKERPNDTGALGKLGVGWIAEEALAIALYCALSATDFRAGVILAVNHSGDSDSTGSMAGQLLGAMYGASAMPTS